MIIKEHETANAETIAHNDDSDLHQDEVGENTGEDTGLATAAREERDKAKESSPKKENL